MRFVRLTEIAMDGSTRPMFVNADLVAAVIAANKRTGRDDAATIVAGGQWFDVVGPTEQVAALLQGGSGRREQELELLRDIVTVLREHSVYVYWDRRRGCWCGRRDDDAAADRLNRLERELARLRA